MNNINVRQFCDVKNQFLIFIGHDVYFQSYDSIIAKIDLDSDLTLYEDWNYSKTTLKYLKLFLDEYYFNNQRQLKYMLECNIRFHKAINEMLNQGKIIKGY